MLVFALSCPFEARCCMSTRISGTIYRDLVPGEEGHDKVQAEGEGRAESGLCVREHDQLDCKEVEKGLKYEPSESSCSFSLNNLMILMQDEEKKKGLGSGTV
jgi:hypothetical protein